MRTGLWGCPCSAPQPRVFKENSETHRPTACVLGLGEGPGHLWAQTKGQRCRKLHLYPLLWLRASCAPTEGPEIAPTQAATQSISFWLFEGRIEKEPQTSLFQNRILACPLVKLLFSARFCSFSILKHEKQREGSIIFSICTSLRPACMCCAGPLKGAVMHRSRHLEFGNATNPYLPTTQLPISPHPPTGLAQVQLCKHWH